jgi:hypothetical protein
MPAPSRAGRLVRRIYPRNLSQLATTFGLCLACALGAANCGFPEYDFVSPGAGGSSAGSDAGVAGGLSGGAGAGASSGSGGQGGSAGSSPSGGGAGEAGAAGVAGAAGAACVFPPPVTFPAHCFDGKVSSGSTSSSAETGVDCGGADCVPCSGAQPCKSDSDCTSNVCTSGKTCSQILSLTYMSIVADASTPTPKFSLTITYLDKVSTPLQTLRIRYYYSHGQVAEPILAHTQATFDPGGSQRNLASSELSYQVYRLPPGPADSNGIVTDSYLELTFPSGVSLTQNSVLNLTQDLVVDGSDPSAEFQQATDYSFINTGSFIPNNAITVYSGDQLLWGVPPPMNVLPDCAFAAGVNLNGPTVTVDGQSIQSSGDGTVDYSGATYENSTTLVPAIDTSTATLLHAGFTLGSATANWSVPNGKYWAYAWLTSDLSADHGQLSIQDNQEDDFFDSAGAWARVGPYQIDVLNGNLKLTGSGAVNIAGVELYNVAP